MNPLPRGYDFHKEYDFHIGKQKNKLIAADKIFNAKLTLLHCTQMRYIKF